MVPGPKRGSSRFTAPLGLGLFKTPRQCVSVKLRARLWRQEADLLEDLNIYLQDETLSLKQITRFVNISDEHLNDLLHLMRPSEEELRQMAALSHFENNKIDPYKFGHC